MAHKTKQRTIQFEVAKLQSSFNYYTTTKRWNHKNLTWSSSSSVTLSSCWKCFIILQLLPITKCRLHWSLKIQSCTCCNQWSAPKSLIRAPRVLTSKYSTKYSLEYILFYIWKCIKGNLGEPHGCIGFILLYWQLQLLQCLMFTLYSHG